MKKVFNAKKLFPFIILTISLALVFYFLNRNVFQIKKILEISISDFIFISVISIMVFFVNGLKNKFLLQPFGVNIKLLEWFGISVVNTFWNYLPFQGGLIAKGAYLKRRYSFSYTDYLSMVMGSYLITFCILGLLGCLSLLINFLYLKTYSSMVLIIYGLLLLFPLIIILVLIYNKSTRIYWYPIQRFIQGIRLVVSHQGVMLKVVFSDILIFILGSVRLFIASEALGYQIPLIFYFLIMPLALLSIFTSITPGGLVIREMLIGIFASWLGVSVTESVMAAILDRGVSMIWIFILGIIFNYYLSRRLFRARVKDDQNIQ